MPWIALMSVSQSATRSQNKCKFERLFSKVKNCRLLGGTAPGKLVAALLISDSWETSFRVSVRDASAVCMKLFTCKLRSATWTDASRSSLGHHWTTWATPCLLDTKEVFLAEVAIEAGTAFWARHLSRADAKCLLWNDVNICPESSRSDDSVHARIKKTSSHHQQLDPKPIKFRACIPKRRDSPNPPQSSNTNTKASAIQTPNSSIFHPPVRAHTHTHTHRVRICEATARVHIVRFMFWKEHVIATHHTHLVHLADLPTERDLREIWNTRIEPWPMWNGRVSQKHDPNAEFASQIVPSDKESL